MGRPEAQTVCLSELLSRLRIVALLVTATLPAAAQTPPTPSPVAERSTPDPELVSGVTREASEPGDTTRAVLDVLLFIPRETVELFFAATGTAAGLIEDEQVVPRVADLLHPPVGEIHAFPTAFLETGQNANVGVRALARAKSFASSARAGIGGPHDLVAESKLRFGLSTPMPLALSLEALHDERSALGYLGVGQRPETDARNRFSATTSERASVYRERRERFIAAGGLRPLEDVELIASSSLSRRHLLDPPDGRADSISRVFEPGTVPGTNATLWVVYSELALRGDTRVTRGGPAHGVLVEGYAGRGDVGGDRDASFARLGARGALFLPVLESSNVLSPRLVVDGLRAINGRTPFVELVRQPDYRGFDNRRDFVSAVASVDYRWTIMRYLAARLFCDAAVVAPALGEMELDDPRVAGGFAFDVFSRSTQLGSVSAVGSAEGFGFSFSFGVNSSFGDRQHRN